MLRILCLVISSYRGFVCRPEPVPEPAAKPAVEVESRAGGEPSEPAAEKPAEEAVAEGSPNDTSPPPPRLPTPHLPYVTLTLTYSTMSLYITQVSFIRLCLF